MSAPVQYSLDMATAHGMRAGSQVRVRIADLRSDILRLDGSVGVVVDHATERAPDPTRVYVAIDGRGHPDHPYHLPIDELEVLP